MLKRSGMLPVVIPVVLHHSGNGWSKALRFEELFAPELLAIPALATLVPRFEFLLDDLSHLSDAELRARALDQVAGLTMWALRDARRPADIVRTVHAWLWAVNALLRAPHGAEALRTIFRYISLVTDDTAAARVFDTVHTEVTGIEEVMTLAERWKAEGEAKGRAEGRAEGEAKGKAEGQRALLLRQLALKFGSVPGAAQERVASASEPDLLRWSEAILSAQSLDQVFAGS